MSLRARLLVGIAVVAVVLVGVAGGITRLAESYLVDQVDTRLAATHVGGSAFRPPSDGAPRPRADGAPIVSSFYIGVVEGDTVTTLAEPGLGEGDDIPLPDISADRAREAAGSGGRGRDPDGFFTVGTTPESDTRYRVRATDGPNGVTVVAASLDEVDAALSRLVVAEVAATGAVLAILGLVAFWVLRLGVRPLKTMAHTATQIAAGDLSQRVPPAPPGTEAAELGAALNTMLARIEDSFALKEASEARLRQFVADASHELRTPVTTIRGYAEMHRRGALDEPDELAQAMRRTEAEAERMGTLVNDLLLLARLDQGRPLAQRPVDLGVFAIDAASDVRAVAPGRRVSTTTEADVVVLGDEHRLRQVVANLVGNALAHTPVEASIELRVGRLGQRAVLEVADDGPGIPPGLAGRAFERFTRADPARGRDHGGSGLGLAIVQAIVAAHGGRVALESEPGSGTSVRVELPLACEGPPPPDHPVGPPVARAGVAESQA